MTDAAGWAITAGNLENALELLEQGRSVLWSQSLQLRTDLTRLRLADADLAARLEEVRAALDRAPGPARETEEAPGAGDWSQQLVANRQRELAREWDELVRRARELPGMGTFLAATPYRRLRQAAAGGPVIVVNIGNHRCDALIITTEGVRLRPLPGLTAQECSQRANTLLGALKPPASADSPVGLRKQLISVLFATMTWLWDTTCEPVLNDLRDHGDLPGGQPAQGSAVPPRIWWCPTGPLTVLPLHAAAAAGALQAGPAAAAIHRAVSALRADKPRRPDLWAPYLHIGP